jgi:hypothetical protein
VGYIYRVRVVEVLKKDQWVRPNQVLHIFIPGDAEIGLPSRQRFILALSRFEPKKEEFANNQVSGVREPLTKPGVPFDLKGRYYQVVADRNGTISITDKNSKLINEIRVAIRQRP